MIRLYTAGQQFGLPDPSPFVVKTMMLLKMAGIPYEEAKMSFRGAPKGKIPYLRDGQLLLGDSHFIGHHLEKQFGVDFSGGYDSRELSIGWSVARMCEEHLYWLLVHDRWMDKDNFEKGPKHFFDVVPAAVRPFLRHVIRRQVRKSLWAQGLGRHTETERLSLGIGDINAIAEFMGSNPYLLGSRISGADASTFAMLWGAGAPFFRSELNLYIRQHKPIMTYIDRIRGQFFPEFSL
jgi:glutathione S-transferase